MTNNQKIKKDPDGIAYDTNTEEWDEAYDWMELYRNITEDFFKDNTLPF